MLYFDIFFTKGIAMNKQIKEKGADKLIIVRLRCGYIQCNTKHCNKIVTDIIIEKNDLVAEGHRRRKIHFRNTLLNALKRLGMNPEKIFCDKHKGDSNESDKNSAHTNTTTIDSNSKNLFR